MSEPTLPSCTPPGFIPDLNIDPPPPYCRDGNAESSSGTISHKPDLQSQKDVSPRDLSWLEDATQNKMGQGAAALCDPQQTGHIINDDKDRNTVYRYARSIRGTDEAVRDLFRDIVVLDESGKAHNVPIIWATQEKAVAYILQENVRKDESLVVDRIRLPMLAIHASAKQSII
jgi:type II secretory pathway component PulC